MVVIYRTAITEFNPLNQNLFIFFTVAYAKISHYLCTHIDL